MNRVAKSQLAKPLTANIKATVYRRTAEVSNLYASWPKLLFQRGIAPLTWLPRPETRLICSITYVTVKGTRHSNGLNGSTATLSKVSSSLCVFSGVGAALVTTLRAGETVIAWNLIKMITFWKKKNDRLQCCFEENCSSYSSKAVLYKSIEKHRHQFL